MKTVLEIETVGSSQYYRIPEEIYDGLVIYLQLLRLGKELMTDPNKITKLAEAIEAGVCTSAPLGSLPKPNNKKGEYHEDF